MFFPCVTLHTSQQLNFNKEILISGSSALTLIGGWFPKILSVERSHNSAIPHSLLTAVGTFTCFQVSVAQTYFSLQGWALNQAHELNCRNPFTPGRFLYAMTIFLSMQLCSELVLTFFLSHLLHKIPLQLCKTSHGLVQHHHLYLNTVFETI